MAQVINVWNIRAADGRWAEIHYNQNYTVLALNPNASYRPAADNLDLKLWNLGSGRVALQCGGGYDAYASARYGDYGGQVQFQAPGSGDWITQVGGDETFQVVPTGDGYFALYSPTYNSYVTINFQPDHSAGNSFPLTTGGPVTDVARAARFSAIGLDRPSVFDFLEVDRNASGLSFAGVDLSSKNFSGCNLSGCDLTHVVSMNGCVLNSADMQKAKLSGVNLTNLAISGADLTGADLSVCDFTPISTWASPPILEQADLSNAILPVSLAGGQLAGANLTGANLARCDFTGADLAGATLPSQDLRATTLLNVNLSGADLAGSNLASVRLTGANLAGANLAGSTMANADLTGTNVAGTNLSGIDLTTVAFPSPLTQSTDPDHPTIFAGSTILFSVIGLNWSCLDLTNANIVNLPSGDLTGLNAYATRLGERSFQNYVLDGANFSTATLNQAIFTGASLRNVNFNSAEMVGAVLTGARLDQASLVGAALGGVAQAQAADLTFAYIANCDFSQSNLFGANFAGATLIGANKLSSSTNLQEANFANAYLPTVDFTGAVLQGAKFDGAFMVECVLSADLSPTRDGSIPASLTSACLQGATFQGVNFAGADLSNAAITASAGSIMQQYYDEYGDLTPPTPIDYPAMPLPDPSSFTSETVCPNGATYGANQASGLTLAQMMVGPNAPTSWKPVGAAAAATAARSRVGRRPARTA